MAVKPTKQLLIDARARVERRWTKGKFRDEAGGVCALGALGFGRSQVPRNASQAKKLLISCLPGWSRSVPSFNDARGTDKEDVLELFDCAIAKAE